MGIECPKCKKENTPENRDQDLENREFMVLMDLDYNLKS